jgi:hypothetical protein
MRSRDFLGVLAPLGMKTRKISIIGNGGGGKTTLARALASRLELPLYHVDSVQFIPGMKRRPLEETRAQLDAWSNQSEWIIDGFGPMDSIEWRFKASDVIYRRQKSFRSITATSAPSRCHRSSGREPETCLVCGPLPGTRTSRKARVPARCARRRRAEATPARAARAPNPARPA